MVYKPGFIPLFSQLGKAFCAELSAANVDRADFAEKPAAIVAWIHRTVSRMKVTGSFMLRCETDFGRNRGIFVELRENVGLNLGIACRAPASLPCNKEIYRQRFATVRTGELGEHLA